MKFSLVLVDSTGGGSKPPLVSPGLGAGLTGTGWSGSRTYKICAHGGRGGGGEGEGRGRGGEGRGGEE